MLGRRIRVELGDVDTWCRSNLDAGIGELLFCEGYLSTVLGVELTSGRQAVVKLRTPHHRLLGCAAIHRRAFQQGFPCPEPLVDLAPMGDLMASAEKMVPGGDLYPSSGRAASPFAAALASLISLGTKPTEVPSLDPPLAWTSPDLGASELWPLPDDRDVDLNASDGPGWIDEAGRLARSQLAVSTSPLVVGHGDWHTGNLRWRGPHLHTVWDWDSAIAASEAAIAGLAAAVYPTIEVGSEATVAESEAFLNAYQAERGRNFSDVELKEAWAAGLWNRSFDAKKQSATEGGPKSLTEAEALERQRRILGR